MNYIAKPVQVEAHRIVSVGPVNLVGEMHCALENGENVTASPEMLARFKPSVSDFWVIQSDGYIYLNPADVFERKYILC